MVQSVQERMRETYAQMSAELASIPPLIFVSNSVLMSITVGVLFIPAFGTFTTRAAISLPISITLLWMTTLVVEVQQQQIAITSVREWSQILGTILAVGVLVGIGFVAFILPGVYLLIRTAYAIPIALREDNTPIENIRQSFSRTDRMVPEIGLITGYAGVVVMLCSAAIWMLWTVSYLAPYSASVAAVAFGISGGLGSTIYQKTVIELAREA